MRHIDSGQASGLPSSALASTPAVIGSISPRQLDTIDPIPARPADDAILAEQRAHEARIPAEAYRLVGHFDEIGERPTRVTSVEPRYERALNDIDLGALVGEPTVQALESLVNDIEADPYKFALRIWNLEAFTQLMEHRLKCVERKVGIIGTIGAAV